MEPLDDSSRPLNTRRTSQPVGVPRRFGAGTALIITAMYAALFSLLSVLGEPPEVFGIVAIFCTGIGLSQMILFGGKLPRLASWLSGTILLPAILIGWELIQPASERLLFPVDVFSILTGTAVFGGIFGYLVGCLIASVFLVRERDRDEDGKDKTDKSGPFA
ncbi:MAG TPA: hypothetical protein VMY42_07570 [Thermoguttaceae bacterium]|nr:hypothetical protein [Thermoguttaceae bacterium]